MIREAIQNVALRMLKWSGVHPSDPAVTAMFGMQPSSSGVDVNEVTAMTYSAVFAANRVISETLGSLPCITYKSSKKGKSIAYDHPAYRLLAEEPNPEMSPLQLFETGQTHVNLKGNTYSEIERNNGGEPINLWPLAPDRVCVVRLNTGSLGYLYYPPNEANPRGILPENMLHVPGLGWDGLCGYSVVHMARESIGMGIATERYGAGFFANNARPSGVLTATGKLKNEAKDTIRRTWEEAHKGLDKSHRVAVLDGGLTWQQMSFTPEEAQFLATRVHNLSEIARWFNVPNHMLRDLSRATFSNIEHSSLEFKTYTMRPVAVRWIQEIKRKLFRKEERRKYDVAFDFNELLVADMLTRFRVYQIALLNGIYNLDECRNDEGKNAIPNGLGQTHRIPANTIPVDAPPDETGNDPTNPNESNPSGPGGGFNNEK
jgi:HK97 family phage portal protein